MCGCVIACHFYIQFVLKLTSYWVNVVNSIWSRISSELEFIFTVIYLGNVPSELKGLIVTNFLQVECKSALEDTRLNRHGFNSIYIYWRRFVHVNVCRADQSWKIKLGKLCHHNSWGVHEEQLIHVTRSSCEAELPVRDSGSDDEGIWSQFKNSWCIYLSTSLCL